MGIEREQRYTRDRPCPLCDHHATDPAGHCHGFTSEDGEWVRCTRNGEAEGAELDEACSPPAYKWKRREDGEYRAWTKDLPLTPIRVQKRRDGAYSVNTGHSATPARAATTAPKVDTKSHERREGERVWQYSDTQRVYRRDFRNPKQGGAWDKDVKPQHLNAAGEWVFGNGPGLVQRIYPPAPPMTTDDPVLVPEGEPAVDDLAALGFVALTWRGGCGQATQALDQLRARVRGQDVVLLPDAEGGRGKGRETMAKIAAALVGVAARVRILDLFPGDADSGRDVQDWLHDGGDARAFAALIEAAPDFAPTEAVSEIADTGGTEPDAAYRSFVARRVDVWSLITGGIPEPEPLVSPWLIKGAITAVGSEPGIGKTWLMLHAILAVLRMGLRVLLLDQEAGERQTAARLRDMGMTADEVGRLHYFPFAVGGGLSLAETGRAVREMMRREGIEFIACDSLSKFFGAFRLSENSNDDATLLIGTLFTPLAHEDGRTVLLLDHVVKSPDGGGRYNRGAGSKLADVDVQYSMDAPAPFGRDTMGRIVLTRQKDRLSAVPGTVRFLVGGDGSGAFTMRMEGASDAEPVRVNANSRKFVAALHGEGNTGKTYTEWFGASNAAERTFKDHRTRLLNEGAVAQREDRYYVTPRGIAGYLPHLVAGADGGETGANALPRPQDTRGAGGANSYTPAPIRPLHGGDEVGAEGAKPYTSAPPAPPLDLAAFGFREEGGNDAA